MRFLDLQGHWTRRGRKCWGYRGRSRRLARRLWRWILRRLRTTMGSELKVGEVKTALALDAFLPSSSVDRLDWTSDSLTAECRPIVHVSHQYQYKTALPSVLPRLLESRMAGMLGSQREMHSGSPMARTSGSRMAMNSGSLMAAKWLVRCRVFSKTTLRESTHLLRWLFGRFGRRARRRRCSRA